jgi:hypothetical protein
MAIDDTHELFAGQVGNSSCNIYLQGKLLALVGISGRWQQKWLATFGNLQVGFKHPETPDCIDIFPG